MEEALRMLLEEEEEKTTRQVAEAFHVPRKTTTSTISLVSVKVFAPFKCLFINIIDHASLR